MFAGRLTAGLRMGAFKSEELLFRHVLSYNVPFIGVKGVCKLSDGSVVKLTRRCRETA